MTLTLPTRVSGTRTDDCIQVKGTCDLVRGSALPSTVSRMKPCSKSCWVAIAVMLHADALARGSSVPAMQPTAAGVVTLTLLSPTLPVLRR